MSKIIGLTGQTGAGKTSVTEIAEKQGFTVINCDEIAKSTLKSGSEALAAVVAEFSPVILLPDGSLDRKALAALAFRDEQSTARLNKCVLPYIKADVQLIVAENQNNNILLDAPTLFESGLNEMCDDTVAVVADAELRKQRIMERDSISEEMATQRINAGKSTEFFLNNAGHTVFNNSDEKTFQREFSAVLKSII